MCANTLFTHFSIYECQHKWMKRNQLMFTFIISYSHISIKFNKYSVGGRLVVIKLQLHCYFCCQTPKFHVF